MSIHSYWSQFYLNELYLNVPGAGLISGPGLCIEAQLTVSGSGSGGETGELVLLMILAPTPGCH